MKVVCIKTSPRVDVHGNPTNPVLKDEIYTVKSIAKKGDQIISGRYIFTLGCDYFNLEERGPQDWYGCIYFRGLNDDNFVEKIIAEVKIPQLETVSIH